MFARGQIGEAVKTADALHSAKGRERDRFCGMVPQARARPDLIAGAPGPCVGEERASTGSCRADGTDAALVRARGEASRWSSV